VQVHDAIEMLAGGVFDTRAAVWADLGCGAGTFTMALASRLAPGSTIHAIDRDAAAVRQVPAEHLGVTIVSRVADIAVTPAGLDNLDGILMANSLHYVEDQAAFIRGCESHMKPRRHFLIVEYDTQQPSRWVPYPVSRTRLAALFEHAGYGSIRVLRSRPSIYRRAPLYAAAIGLG
jgi:trans-aconitate methyltransferase